MPNPISKLNLVINGVTTQLDVHDPNALTSEIDSMGTDWVRFKCGLQICYGTAVNNNGLGTGISRFSFPMAFSATPNLVATPNNPAGYLCTVRTGNASTWVLYTYAYTVNKTIEYITDPVACNFIAVGTWK